jgi:hypothetical protein
LLKINKEVKNGFKLRNEGFSISLEKGNVSLCFDRIIPTTIVFVTGDKRNEIHPETTYNAMASVKINKSFDINHIYKGFGHCGFETLRRTAKIHNSTMFGNAEGFEDCAILKANQ